MLRGRAEPTSVHSPWPHNATPERRAAWVEAYRAMETGQDEAARLFADLARSWPDDPAAAYWSARLAAGSPV